MICRIIYSLAANHQILVVTTDSMLGYDQLPGIL